MRLCVEVVDDVGVKRHVFNRWNLIDSSISEIALAPLLGDGTESVIQQRDVVVQLAVLEFLPELQGEVPALEQVIVSELFQNLAVRQESVYQEA